MANVHWFLKEYPQFELDDIYRKSLVWSYEADVWIGDVSNSFREFTIVTDSL